MNQHTEVKNFIAESQLSYQGKNFFPGWFTEKQTYDFWVLTNLENGAVIESASRHLTFFWENAHHLNLSPTAVERLIKSFRFIWLIFFGVNWKGQELEMCTEISIKVSLHFQQLMRNCTTYNK
jgi:hypothetical protein